MKTALHAALNSARGMEKKSIDEVRTAAALDHEEQKVDNEVERSKEAQRASLFVSKVRSMEYKGKAVIKKSSAMESKYKMQEYAASHEAAAKQHMKATKKFKKQAKQQQMKRHARHKEVSEKEEQFFTDAESDALKLTGGKDDSLYHGAKKKA